MSSGFNFNNTSGLAFGAKTSAPAAGATGFSFGAKASAPAAGAPGLSFGAQTSVPAAGATGFSFGAKTSAPAAAAGAFSLGQSLVKSQPAGSNGTAPASSFSFGQASTNGKTLPSFGTSVVNAVTSKPSTFSFTGAATSSKPASFSQVVSSSLPASTAPASSLSFGSAVSSNPSTSTAGFSLKSTPAVSLTSTLTLAQSSSTTTSSIGLSASNSALKSSTALSSTTAPPVKEMSYKELEETVEKWLHELTEQENVFLNQALQVNIWDKQLIENGEKIAEVHNEVERVKAEQQRLNRELDFILSQQEELEDLLKPIEAEMKKQNMVQHIQPSDMERDRTFQLAENVDSQLKHMMQDLREIIDHVNNSNSKPTNGDDAMAHIAKILNAHMDSLQWVDQNSNQLQKRVEEVAQLLENRKRDHDKSYH